jgi:alcohol dehydrogenase class IV
MADFTIKISAQTLLGPDVVNRLALISGAWAERCLIVVDPALYDSNAVDRVKAILDARAIQFIIYDEIADFATSRTAEEILNLARGSRSQALIGLGGARVISLAKLVASAARGTCSVDDLLDGRPSDAEGLPFIAVPTAYRDPFLFQDRAIVTDARDRSARVVATAPDIARLVLIDPTLSSSLSSKASSLLCLDIVLECLEGYISQRASFFSDTIFEKALELAFKALDGFIARPEDPQNRQLATEASFLSAYGLASSSLGIGSALSFVVNARYAIPKASLSTIFLPYVMEGAAASRVEKMARLAKISGEEIDGLDSSAAAGKAVDGLRQRLGSLRVPTRLKDFDLKLDDLVELASAARDLEFCAYLPRTLSVEDVYDIVKQAY